MIALDVGTRSIIAAEHDGQTILRLVHLEHAGLFMREGTIHDFEGAVATIRAARERLDLPEGTPVAMAIAGGAMTTRRMRVTVEGPGPWSETDLARAESKVLTDLLAAKNSKGKVLLGVRRSAPRLDGRQVGSLLCLSGGKAEFDLLAAFVPEETLRIKMQAVVQAGFRPERVTAEPLAISRALFGRDLPPALFVVCDIGAGTSDLAVISSRGIESVGAVARAGDTITESIAKGLGLSFMDADAVKRDPDHEVVDFWGERRRFGREAVKAAAAEGTATVATKIAAALKKTARTVDGIVLAGGGSLWPDLAPQLAEALGLDPIRIRTRNAETIEEIVDQSGMASGPLFLTLYGIILSRAEAVVPVSFRFRDKNYSRMLRLPDGAIFTVADALGLADEDPLDYFGEPGEAWVEGKTIRAGEPGEAPIIRIDGAPATLDAPFPPGALLTIEHGASGANAAPDPARTSVPPEDIPVMAVPIISPAEHMAISPPPVTMPDKEEPAVLPTKPPNIESTAAKNLDPLESPTAGFMIINGAPVYCGERLRIDKSGDGAARTIEADPPRLEEIVPLPVPRSIQITLNGTPHVIRERTRSALANNQRHHATDRVPWESIVSTRRDAWRIYEALGDVVSLPTRITCNGREVLLGDALRDGDAVVTS